MLFSNVFIKRNNKETKYKPGVVEIKEPVAFLTARRAMEYICWSVVSEHSSKFALSEKMLRTFVDDDDAFFDFLLSSINFRSLRLSFGEVTK